MARRRFRISILIGCLILACILWGFVTLTRMYEDDVLVPLVVQAPQNQALLSTVPTEVTVHVRASGLQILNLKFFNRSALCSVDLSRLNPTSQGVYTVDREHFIRGITTPEPVHILSVFPASITMATGDLFVKSVPARPQTNIAAREGFVVVGAPTPDPQVVEVRGTRSVVEGILSWPTKKISLADLHESVSTVVDMSDSLTTLLNVVPPRIRINVNVQQLADICIPDVPVVVDGKQGVTLLPQRVSITVRGGIEELASLTATDFRASISSDVRGYTRPTVTSSSRVHVVATSPAWLRVMSIASP